MDVVTAGLVMGGLLFILEYAFAVGSGEVRESEARQWGRFWLERLCRAAALSVALALAFRPGWWIALVVVAQLAIGGMEHLVQGAAHARARALVPLTSCASLISLILLVVLAAVTASVVKPRPGFLAVWIWQAVASIPRGFARGVSPLGMAAVFLAYVFTAQPANEIVRSMLSRAGVAPFRTDCAPENTLKAGRTIGILERWIMVTFILLGQYSALGLTLTAKSIARFSKIEHDPGFAEYYLLGTLYSMFIALITGLILRVVAL